MGCKTSKSLDTSTESVARNVTTAPGKPAEVMMARGNGTGPGAPPEEEFIEAVVCGEAEIGDNEMKQVDLGEGKVLLVRQNGKLSAIGAKCSHYGAPLVTGALGKGRVRCPWHGACFNVTTGDIEDFPGQDSLPCYQVSVEAGQVRVRARKAELASNKRMKPMSRRVTSTAGADESTFVVIGAGPSGAICAETLRQEGYIGRIVMIGKEPSLPYDRVKVSKSMDVAVEKIVLRSPQFYEENDIEVMLGTEVTALDSSTRQVTLSNGYKIRYDKAYVATGSKARRAPIEGSDLRNVFVVREHDHGRMVNEQLGPEKTVVILGSSFIGLEAAAFCVGKVAKVIVIGRSDVPLKETFGHDVGRRVMELFQEKGVEFIMNSGIKRCNGNDEAMLTSVELADGTVQKADICIFGIGSTLYTQFLNGSGVELNRDGSIKTNEYLESNIADVYCGGDIANAPVYAHNNQRATIGHYPLAQYHGRIAALNMVGKQTPLHVVPFFWTMVFGKSFRYAGYGTPAEVIIDGDLAALKFVAFYIDQQGHVIAMSSCQRDPVVSQYAEYRSQGKQLHKSQLEPDRFAWTKET